MTEEEKKEILLDYKIKVDRMTYKEKSIELVNLSSENSPGLVYDKSYIIVESFSTGEFAKYQHKLLHIDNALREVQVRLDKYRSDLFLYSERLDARFRDIYLYGCSTYWINTLLNKIRSYGSSQDASEIKEYLKTFPSMYVGIEITYNETEGLLVVDHSKLQKDIEFLQNRIEKIIAILKAHFVCAREFLQRTRALYLYPEYLRRMEDIVTSRDSEHPYFSKRILTSLRGKRILDEQEEDILSHAIENERGNLLFPDAEKILPEKNIINNNPYFKKWGTTKN